MIKCLIKYFNVEIFKTEERNHIFIKKTLWSTWNHWKFHGRNPIRKSTKLIAWNWSFCNFPKNGIISITVGLPVPHLIIGIPSPKVSKRKQVAVSYRGVVGKLGQSVPMSPRESLVTSPLVYAPPFWSSPLIHLLYPDFGRCFPKVKPFK